jgi:hypothetical protein
MHYTIGKLWRIMNGERRKMNMKAQIIAILALLLSVSFASAQEKIIVGGSGSLNEEFTDFEGLYGEIFFG